LILNRETFELPPDGWNQIAPIGEFPHAGAGVVQVVDAAACEAMAAAFRAESASPNFAGLLIDFDHFSLDGKQKSEAAGWITALEARVGKTEDGRL
jgi:phage I-like protein